MRYMADYFPGLVAAGAVVGWVVRLGWADARLAQRRVDDGCDDGRAAVDVEFDDVFAGEAVWAGKPER